MTRDVHHVVITGATGFVGGRVLATTVSHGIPVTVVLRRGSPNVGALEARWPSVHFVEDPGTALGLAEALSDVSAATIFHLATHFVAHHDAADIESLAETNFDFGVRIAEAARHIRARAFVYSATLWQRPGNQDSPPVSLYAAVKQALEDVLGFYSSAYGLPVRTVVLSDTYGPGDGRRKILGLLLEHLHSGEILKMSSGRQYVDLVHVDDVCSALIRASRLDGESGRWSVSSGRPIRVSELVDLVESTIGVRPPVVFGALDDRPREMYEPWVPPPLVPGWAPERSLAAGIEELWNVVSRAQ